MLLSTGHTFIIETSRVLLSCGNLFKLSFIETVPNLSTGGAYFYFLSHVVIGVPGTVMRNLFIGLHLSVLWNYADFLSRMGRTSTHTERLTRLRCMQHHAAAMRVVRLLLENGADINARRGRYGNALQAALFYGYEGIVRLLLENGADVNAQGGDYGNALQAASSKGDEGIVRLLLENGANVDAQGGRHGNALQVAIYKGHEGVVRLLLENGADVNAQGGPCGYALQTASYKGYEGIVRLLLENGADVNAQGGHYGSALRAASDRGHENIVQLLLERGAIRVKRRRLK